MSSRAEIETHANGAIGKVVVEWVGGHIELCTGWEGPVPVTPEQAIEIGVALIAAAGINTDGVAKVNGGRDALVTAALSDVNTSGDLPPGLWVTEWVEAPFIGCPEEGHRVDETHLHVILNDPPEPSDHGGWTSMLAAFDKMQEMTTAAAGSFGYDAVRVEWAFPWVDGVVSPNQRHTVPRTMGQGDQ